MAKDKIHNAVRTALEKDGWEITDDPFHLDTGFVEFEMDLAAQKLFVAQKEHEKIIVEIKTFGDPSLVYSFHIAMGQYMDYRSALGDENIDRPLFLAISQGTWRRMTKIPFFQKRFKEFQVKIIVVNIITETIVEWIN